MIDDSIIETYCLGGMVCNQATLICDDGFTPCVQTFRSYDEYTYWDGEVLSTSYPQESCVGEIFINDNMNLELRAKTLIELNMDEIDERTIRDTSGNGYKGILLGDYAIRKDSKEIRVRRETDIKIPETDNEGKAF